MAYTDPEHEAELVAWERDMEERGSWYTGDARRCPRHPHIKTSSDDGMFDGLCGECEAEMDSTYYGKPDRGDEQPRTEASEALASSEDARIERDRVARAQASERATAEAEDDIPF